MIVVVTKALTKYPIGTEIDLDSLAEKNLEEYTYIMRKIQEGGCIETKSFQNSPENKAIQSKEIKGLNIGEGN